MTGLDPVRDERISLIDFLNRLCYNSEHGKIKPDSEGYRGEDASTLRLASA